MWTVGFCATRNLSFYGPPRNSAPGVPGSGTQRAAATTARCVPLFGEDTQRPRVSSQRHRRSPRAPSAVPPVVLFASKRRRGATPRWSGEGTGRPLGKIAWR